MGNLTVKESGEMVNFISPNVSKITSFKVHFSPKQEGSGDPSPENVREITGWNGVEGYKCGKNMAHIFGYGTQTITDTDVNKYKITNAYGTTINTTIFNNPDTPLIIEQSQAPNSTTPNNYHNGYIVIGTDSLVFGQKYNVSFKVSNITNNILNISLNNIKLLVPTGTSKSVTEIIDDVLIFKNVTFYQSTVAPKRQSFEIRICGLSFTLSEFMVTAVDNNDFTYEPYQDNIYSKEWTKNLLDIWEKPNGYKPSSNTNGNYGWSKEWIVTDELKGKTITYSTFIDNTNANDNGYVHIWTKDSEGNYIKTNIIPPSNKQIIAGESGRSYVNLILTDNIYSVIFGITVSANAIAKYPMVELGSEPAEYQPYVGDVYGGYVDLISGELVVDKAMETFDGSETWNTATVSSKTAYQTRRPADIASGAVFTSNIITRVSSLSGTVPDNVGYFGGTYLNVYAPSLSLEEWTAMLTATPLQIVYKLAESITYQLTPQQLSTLKGQNNFWSNADYIEIEYELTETFDIQKAKRKIILNQPHVESASGDLVTFDTDMKGKLKECKVYFSPVQEGEGDPSPDNVRNIVGWNGVNIYKAGQNLIPENIPVQFYRVYPSGGHFIESGTAFSTFFIPVPKGKICLARTTRALLSYGALCDELPTVGASAFNAVTMTNRDNHIFDNSEGHKYFAITTGRSVEVNSNWESFLDTEPRLTMGDTVQPYIAPTNISTHLIDWTDDVGTIYGGYIDLISGELVQTWYGFILDGVNNYLNSIPKLLDNGLATIFDHIGSGGLSNLPVGPYNHYENRIICDKYPVKYRSDSEGIVTNSGRLYIRLILDPSKLEDVSSTSAIRESMIKWQQENPLQIVYSLETPIIYQLTPQQILTFKGTNNVYSNTNGQTEIKYWKH